MALNPSQLSTDLEALFASPSGTLATLAGQWGSALSSYASAIVPASAAVASATAALETTLAGVFSTSGTGPDKAADMEAAFLSWATAIGAGMVGYTPTPPPGSIGFAAEFAKDPGDWKTTHAQAATFWSAAIDTWMKTGTATLIAPPNTVVPWS